MGTRADRVWVYKIKQLSRKYDAVMGYGHDMEKFEALKKAPEYYE